MYDLLIVGGGPAGISAALTAYNRHRQVLLLTNSYQHNPLCRAHLVTNYPGMDQISGEEMLASMYSQLRSLKIPVAVQKVVQVLNMGSRFSCAAGSDVYEGSSVILTVGHMPKATVSGEAEYLGRGVSYCATCDGMLYRGRDVAVLGFSEEAAEEANFLAGIGCKVRYFGKGRCPAGLREDVPFQGAVQYLIHGDGSRVTGVEADGFLYPTAGVFILRQSVVADSLVPGLRMEDGHIAVDHEMNTSVPGVFAAGDCVGKPYQVAKAVGDGNIAALTCDRWLEQNERRL